MHHSVQNRAIGKGLGDEYDSDVFDSTECAAQAIKGVDRGELVVKWRKSKE